VKGLQTAPALLVAAGDGDPTWRYLEENGSSHGSSTWLGTGRAGQNDNHGAGCALFGKRHCGRNTHQEAARYKNNVPLISPQGRVVQPIFDPGTGMGYHWIVPTLICP
jgi:hypothetical protein